jgi:predicted metal-dependent peptidase
MDTIVREIMQLSRNTVLIQLRFLDAALFELKLQAGGTEAIATDGKHLYYDHRHVIGRYREAKAQVARDYLHVVMHCIFQHPFTAYIQNPEIWDLACDMAVEHAINGMGVRALEVPHVNQQTAILATYQSKVKFLTAEKLYRQLLDDKLSDKKLSELRALFRADEHELWYAKNKETDSAAESGGKSDGDSEKQNSKSSTYDAAETWKNISKRVEVDLETTSKDFGTEAGGLTQNLKAVHREKYDYGQFLKRFSVLGEAMQVNDDEFDYIFYTYGLQLYQRMPLIEPLEYKEVKRVKEFVIAIDTSGSCSGETVEAFINKTYNILKQGENFFTKINVHIVQCDSEIQDVVKVTNQQEFEHYLQTMQLKGFGGTDFRPVFDYVDAQIQAKEFTDLKGLIYFTDGYGTFPAKKPNYHTAFVFLEEDYGEPKVPNWAIKLVLTKDEI